MNFEVIKADPKTESQDLSAMDIAVLPNEKPFPQTVWMEEKIETYWIKVNGEKVGIISIERDSAPGATYDAESEVSPGSIYLILIGLIPGWQGKGFGKLAMEWLKVMVRSRKGYTRIVSNLRQSNTPSLKLHTSMGFREIALKWSYYSDPNENSPVLELKI